MAAGVTIQLKRKSGAFTGGDLVAGELGLDVSTGSVYVSVDGATVKMVGSSPKELRFAIDSVDDLSAYTGKADKGTSEDAEGWTVVKTVFEAGGTVDTRGSAAGKWDDRETLTYI